MAGGGKGGLRRRLLGPCEEIGGGSVTVSLRRGFVHFVSV